MIRILFIFVLFLTILSRCSDSLNGDLIISNVNVVDVKTGEIIPNQDVVIIGAFIAAIKASKSNRNHESGRGLLSENNEWLTSIPLVLYLSEHIHYFF